MRYPNGGIFINGSPDQGTIVRAEFLNALLGEIEGILELANLTVQQTGDLPQHHRQAKVAIASSFVRVGDVLPTYADDGHVFLSLTALREGQWPFYVSQSGEWLAQPIPDFEVSSDTNGDGSTTPELFTDVHHGERGGGDLHALATEYTAGFMSAAGVRALNLCTAALGHQLSLPAVQLIAYSVVGGSLEQTLAQTRQFYGASPYNRLPSDSTFRVSVSYSQIESYFDYLNDGDRDRCDLAGSNATSATFNLIQAATVRAVMDLGRRANAAQLSRYMNDALRVAGTIFENRKLNLLRSLS
ncbi:MAG: hypothetical protein DDT26_00817 [Dehalococcoidia bacterium]|nr:hypothetical protein [Chloroflexota bacterium]